MDRIDRLLLAAQALIPERLKALVNVDGEEKALPIAEIRDMLESGKIMYENIGGIVHDGGNDLNDLDAWLNIIRDRAFQPGRSGGEHNE